MAGLAGSEEGMGGLGSLYIIRAIEVMMSYFEVPGTATAKQDGRTDSWDGRTDIGMSGQVFGWAGQRCL